jgi:uncharacterized protein HemX
MTTIEIVLAIISIISFGLAVYSFVKNEIKKANERANVETLKERLKTLSQNLELLFQAANAIIQVPKNREVKVEELQDLARVLRSQIYLLSEKTRKMRLRLDDWQFGVMLKSESVKDNDVLEHSRPEE